jgi:hypothetical protein
MSGFLSFYEDPSILNSLGKGRRCIGYDWKTEMHCLNHRKAKAFMLTHAEVKVALFVKSPKL